VDLILSILAGAFIVELGYFLSLRIRRERVELQVLEDRAEVISMDQAPSAFRHALREENLHGR